jgi:hypothetical protein
MKLLFGLLAGVSLLVCTLVAFCYFWGAITMPQYKMILFIASIAYFVFATLWATRRGSRVS